MERLLKHSFIFFLSLYLGFLLSVGILIDEAASQDTSWTVPRLIEALKGDSEGYVRYRAAVALGEIGFVEPEAVAPSLIEALKDPSEGVRAGATEALGKIGSAEAVAPLIEALKGDSADYVRYRAAVALGKVGSAEAVAPLIEALKGDSAGYVRYCAAVALGKIGSAEAVAPSLIEALKDPSEGVRAGATEALGKIGSAEAVAPLIEALEDPSEDVRAGATEALGRIGPAAVPHLIEALKDPSEDVRNGATEALERIGEPAVPLLIVALGDPSVHVRLRVMSILGRIGPASAPAVPHLIEALKNVEEEGMFAEALSALTNIGAPAVPQLIEALRHSSPYVRQGVAVALRDIGEPAISAIPFLEEAIKRERDGSVRIYMTRVLEELLGFKRLRDFEGQSLQGQKGKECAKNIRMTLDSITKTMRVKMRVTNRKVIDPQTAEVILIDPSGRQIRKSGLSSVKVGVKGERGEYEASLSGVQEEGSICFYPDSSKREAALLGRITAEGTIQGVSGNNVLSEELAMALAQNQLKGTDVTYALAFEEAQVENDFTIASVGADGSSSFSKSLLTDAIFLYARGGRGEQMDIVHASYPSTTRLRLPASIKTFGIPSLRSPHKCSVSDPRCLEEEKGTVGN